MPYGSGPAPDQRTVNGFFCTGCNSLLLSLFTHDCKTCECGNMVDGGNEYVRRGYQDEEAFTKVVEIYDWAPILALAEVGGALALGNETHAEVHDLLVGIDKYVEDERLIPVNKAYLEEVEESGDSGIVGLPDEAELAAEQAAKQDEDKLKADALFHKFSLGIND